MGAPCASLLGKNLALQGLAGSGQHCKIANQVACAVGIFVWCEALAYARRAGLDPAQEIGLELPDLDCAWTPYDRVAERGWEEFGMQVLYRLCTSL